MNANAYGGELARVLEWVDVCTAAGVERRPPERARVRVSALEPARRARSSRSPRSRSPRPTRRRSRRPWPRCAASAARRSRRGSRPSARPSRTPTTDARPAAAPPASCSRRPGARGSPSAAPGSRRSTRTSSRTPATATTADVLAVMAAARRRVHERFGVVLEPEVQVLGEVEWPAGLGARRGSSRRGQEPGPRGEMIPDEPSSGRYACRQTTRVRATGARPKRPRRSRGQARGDEDREAEARRRSSRRRAERRRSRRRRAAPRPAAPTAKRDRGYAAPGHVARAPARTARSTRRRWSRPRPVRALRGPSALPGAHRLAIVAAPRSPSRPATSSGCGTPRWSRSPTSRSSG